MKTTVGIIGCGNIAEQYVNDLPNWSHIELVAVSDLLLEKAETLARNIPGCKVYKNLTDMLADETIELIINLSIHHVHYDVIKQSLNAGKHVYSEKPLAMTHKEAQELVDLAKTKKLILGCSPFTALSHPAQEAYKVIRSGKLGRIRLIYAEVNWGRIETWHPNPVPFYDVGPLYDVGVYPLTGIVSFMGPVRTVSAFGRHLHKNRTTLSREKFSPRNYDFVLALLELESGATVRLTCNFYVGHHNKQGSGIEFHGDDASLHLSSWIFPNASVEFTPFDKKDETQLIVKGTEEETISWCTGVADTVDAIQKGKESRVHGARAAHIVEVLEGIQKSIETKEIVHIYSAAPVIKL